MKLLVRKFFVVFCLVLVFGIVTAVQAAESGIQFTDVPDNYWAKTQIEYFAEKEIVNGYEDGSFKPDKSVSREEFCKLLVATFDQPLEYPTVSTFSDVLSDRWSYPYVEVCREFLTGYQNPFGGKPAFHPAEDATREDIAVALVRMMGYTDADANNPNYALWKFTDGSAISPGLLGYVSIACEKGLINGYPDGTFGPTKGISRAETVVMLNRATKQAVTNIYEELDASAEVLCSKDGKTATLHITADTGATATVNGETVKLSSNGYGQYEGNYTYTFTAEGRKDFSVVVKKAGKEKAFSLTARYEIPSPELTITQCPTSVTNQTVTISGTLKDAQNSCSLTINGRDVYVNSYDGKWSESFTLREGSNTFVFTATNSYGKTVTKEKTITFKILGPELSVTKCPSSVTSKNVTICGTARDDTYGVTLTVNGESVYVSPYDGSWSKSCLLQKGTNIFTIVATNGQGKTESVTKTITLEAVDPSYAAVMRAGVLTIDGNRNKIAEYKLLLCDSSVIVVGDKNYQNYALISDGDIITFETFGDEGYIEEVQLADYESASVLAFDGNDVNLDGTIYEITEDTVIFLIDEREYEAVITANDIHHYLTVADKYETGEEYIKNVLFYDDGDRELELLVIDINNQLDNYYLNRSGR